MSYEEMLKTVNEYFGDTSRSQAETRAGLQQLMDEIEIMADSLLPPEAS